jgi:hypothetical protein
MERRPFTRQTRTDHIEAQKRINRVPLDRLRDAESQCRGLSIAKLLVIANEYCRRNQDLHPAPMPPDRLDGRLRILMLCWFALHPECLTAPFEGESADDWECDFDLSDLSFESSFTPQSSFPFSRRRAYCPDNLSTP